MSTNQNLLHLRLDLIHYSKYLMAITDNNKLLTSKILFRTLDMDANYADQFAQDAHKSITSHFLRWQLISYYHHYLSFGVLKTAEFMNVSPNTVQKYKKEALEKIYVPTYDDIEYLKPCAEKWHDLKHRLKETDYKFIF